MHGKHEKMLHQSSSKEDLLADGTSLSAVAAPDLELQLRSESQHDLLPSPRGSPSRQRTLLSSETFNDRCSEINDIIGMFPCSRRLPAADDRCSRAV